MADGHAARACFVLVLAFAPLACRAVSGQSLAEIELELERTQTRLESARKLESQATRTGTGKFDFALQDGSEERLDAFVALKDESPAFSEFMDRPRVKGTEPTGEDVRKTIAPVREELEKRETKLKVDAADQRALFGAKWGAGVGFLTGGSREVQEASITNGVVSVDKSSKSKPVVLLETHIFPWQPACKLMQFGVGPFAALGVSEDDLIDGIGGGIMFGGRRLSRDASSTAAFNVAIGPYLIGEVQQLAAGFVEGQAPPPGETSVRYRTEEDWKLLVMFSFSWSF